ncbi:hypothetical protein [Succinimonas amylolytica]|uniref:LpxL/LpxP family acyltransferase n=1 Tax=Succinimonas amylolytica TaxID=83769 RepID=UPI00037A5C8B|nr:hypothetical protein [Succinimonas amylolytica]
MSEIKTENDAAVDSGHKEAEIGIRETEEASWRKESEKTSVLGIKIVLKIYDIFGKRVSLILVWFISLWIWIFSPELRKSSRIYLDRVSTFAASRGICLGRLSTRRHVYRVAENFFERLLTWKGVITAERLNSENHDHERMLARAREPDGAILIGAHVGNSEMLRGMNSSCSRKKVSSFMYARQFPRFMECIRTLNAESGLNIIMPEEITPATGIYLGEKLDAGEWIFIMGDRLLDGDTRSCEVEFLGRKARFPLGPWLLAGIFKKPVYTVHAVKINGAYQLFFREVGEVRFSRKNREQDLRSYVESYARFLEELLLQAPYEWFNFFDFWEEYETLEQSSGKKVSKHGRGSGEGGGKPGDESADAATKRI